MHVVIRPGSHFMVSTCPFMIKLLKKSFLQNNRADCHGAVVAQWVKHWPAVLAVQSSSPTCSEIFSTVNGAPLHTAFHYQPLIILI